MAILNDTQINGNLYVTEDIQIGGGGSVLDKLTNTVKLVKYSDGVSRTIAAYTGYDTGYTDGSGKFPTYDGYTLLGCIGGYGNGQIGLIVNGNGWLFNSSNVSKTYSSVTWYLLYIKN